MDAEISYETFISAYKTTECYNGIKPQYCNRLTIVKLTDVLKYPIGEDAVTTCNNKEVKVCTEYL